METNVKLSTLLVSAAKKASKASDRTVKEQLEYWMKLGQLVEGNPELTYSFIKKELKGQ